MGWTGEGIRALSEMRKAQLAAKARKHQARLEPQPARALETVLAEVRDKEGDAHRGKRR
jgi:hypothetical protein